MARKRSYIEFLPYCFKRFSMKSAQRTALPTAWFYIRRPALPASSRPALFTMNIFPPMMTLWHHFARRAVGDRADIVIFDCSGTLDPRDFPGARVQKFLNPRHAMKCDAFLSIVARRRKIAWVCDDDVFILSPRAVDVIERELSMPKTACVSFIPRPWWEFDIDGTRYPPSGTYCIALNREIFTREKLSFRPANGNNHPAIVKPPKRYDSFDYANEQLIRRGYRCAITTKEERTECTTGFTGLSGGVMLLNELRRPEQVIEYLETPSEESWSGTMLPGMLSALLAITAIRDLAASISGKRYPLPGLPEKAALIGILEKRRSLIRPDFPFEDFDEAAERLRRLL